MTYTATRPHRPDTPGMVHELTHTHTHTERITTHTTRGTTITEPHHVTAPPLLDQLTNATTTADGHSAYGGYGSRPTANLDALDLHQDINHQATTWLQHHGHRHPGTTLAAVRLAGSLHPQTTTCTTPATQREDGCCLTHDIARWWTRARILTGWDAATWSPNTNTCPHCAARGTLRIRLADHAAICTHTDPDTQQRCGATWDHTTIGLLAEHIRAENHDQIDAATSPDTSPDTSLDTDTSRLYVASFGPDTPTPKAL